MKSAKELAMEKLGIGKEKKLTDSQKKEIAEIRQIAKAKRAEEEIMLQNKIAGLPESEEKEILREQTAQAIRKIEARAEEKIEGIRSKRR